ncbi:RagB/SusD family nutrient uptake outer membrane protein [Paludibacter sp.]
MKYMNYKLILLLPVLTAIVFFSSCRDFLDIDEYTVDMFEYDSIFGNKQHMEEYLWGAAALLPDEANIWGSSSASGANMFPGVSASDEAFNQWENSTQPGTMFVQGEINADNVANYFNGRTFNFWTNMYKIIRKTNLILKNIDKTKDLSTIEKNNLLGYTYFLRAYAYYHILMNQGPVIIVGEQVYEVNKEANYYNNHRATYDESVEYICAEFERAAKLMSIDRVPISQYGRPNRGAAYALIARVRLQHASPLFNGGGKNGSAANRYYSNWKRSSDNANYINQSYDEKRWAVAAWAAKRVIDLKLYDLHTVRADTLKIVNSAPNPDLTPKLPAGISNKANWPDGPNGIDHLKSYANMFNGETLPYQNKEIIWGRFSNSVRAYTQHSFSIFHGGYGGMAIPQKIIDNYYMNDGQDYPNIGVMNATKFSKDSIWSGYKIGANRVNMYYINREPRFYASIGYQQCYWPMLSNTDTKFPESTRYMDYTKSGQDGYTSALPNKTDYTLTGYVIKKYIHPNDAWTGDGNKRIEKSFPIIRYAEILLAYAEALNNLNSSYEIDGQTFSRDTEEIRKYFNLVRYRAGLPGLSNTDLSTTENMFHIIERERMIEFLHEGRRYYDVRRWGVYEDREREPITGMDVEANGDAFYNVVRINNAVARNRVIHKRMMFLPLSTTELKKVSGLDQNYGW